MHALNMRAHKLLQLDPASLCAHAAVAVLEIRAS